MRLWILIYPLVPNFSLLNAPSTEHNARSITTGLNESISRTPLKRSFSTKEIANLPPLPWYRERSASSHPKASQEPFEAPAATEALEEISLFNES